jgi:hypothetical protein
MREYGVYIDIVRVIRPAFGLGEFCACRAGVVVVLGVVDEVLPSEEAAFGPARPPPSPESPPVLERGKSIVSVLLLFECWQGSGMLGRQRRRGYQSYPVG